MTPVQAALGATALVCAAIGALMLAVVTAAGRTDDRDGRPRG